MSASSERGHIFGSKTGESVQYFRIDLGSRFQNYLFEYGKASPPHRSHCDLGFPG